VTAVEAEHPVGPAFSFSTRTDAQGRFRLEHLSQVPMRVHAITEYQRGKDQRKSEDLLVAPSAASVRLIPTIVEEPLKAR
jgi:hypothetical protein